MKRLFKAIWLGLIVTAWAPAQATVIGVAVADYGASQQIGDFDSDGTINFYALLNGSGVYGVDNAGLESDSCTTWPSSSQCTGGRLDMWLRFSPVTEGLNELNLHFSDLDLLGAHDPYGASWRFLESVKIYESSSTTPIVTVDDVWDSPVVQADRDSQWLRLSLDVLGDPYFVRLRFRTIFDNLPSGRYVNTQESVLATITGRSVTIPPVSVSEPTTLTLLGGGLLLIGFVATRRRN